MTQEEYSAFYDSIDFMEGALNVYRTKNYIVRQQLSIENIEGKTVIFSRDTFFKKTEKRNEAFEFIYCFRNADEAEGKRVPATATTRKYVD